MKDVGDTWSETACRQITELETQVAALTRERDTLQEAVKDLARQLADRSALATPRENQDGK